MIWSRALGIVRVVRALEFGLNNEQPLPNAVEMKRVDPAIITAIHECADCSGILNLAYLTQSVGREGT
ncbi:hypothetical protein DF3PB_20087 [uncultured Defluviicoccus sp.]|uniref:Uncharacterized protein n=1 Tax=metagenome TaxID=256318 RepID=A0A380TB40_9ZZZZ|nr:hypothetical protein DF3PB_20087 [uncultured Defluviicoccus sp.]